MNTNTLAQAYKKAFFHPSILLEILVLVLYYMHSKDFEDFALQIFYNPKGIGKSCLKK